ncbi:MAG: hypothetical protein JST54_03250 [Deltaproteobacteria bacterium]|nr:hypothetical protein [Deltaproteobacteria bacterium]
MSDLLSGIGSAVTGLVGEVAGEAGGIPDPIASGIELIANAVGLDPKITGAIELGAAFFTGDLACAMHGANDILNGKSKSASTDASSPSAPPTPGYASPAKTDLPTPPTQMDDHTVLQTIRDNYAAIDTNGDGKITSGELADAASNPKLPQNVRDACTALFNDEKLSSEFGKTGSIFDSNEGFIGGHCTSHVFTMSQLDEELTRHPATSATSTSGSTPSTSGNTGVVPPSVANGDVNTSGETYQQALQTISDNFSLFDTAAGVGAPDGLIGRNDLQAILNNPGAPADVKAAAKFMLDNPAYFNEAETAQYGGKMDGLLGKGDVAAALAQVKASPAANSDSTPSASGGSTTTTQAGGSNASSGTSQTSSNPSAGGSDATDSQINSDINAILNDPSMTPEDKVLAILMKLEEKKEHDVQNLTGQLVNIENTNNANQGKKDANGNAIPQQSETGVQMQLQQAMSAMQELQTMATNFEKTEHDTKMSVINNLR